MEHPTAGLMPGRTEKAEGQLDVEKAADDVHLHNDIVDTVYWDKISVKVEDRYLLNSIDGAALAGQPNVLTASTLGLRGT